MRKISLFQRNFVELTGVVHNHSNHSYDCNVPLRKVIDAAYKNQLDYLTINDHHVHPPKEEVAEELNYFKNEKQYEPYLIVGSELNDPEGSHHLLVFNGNIPPQELPINELIEAGKSVNAIMFAAHPYETRACKRFPLYVWKELELLKEIDGMEIWNYSSSWLSRLNPKLNGLFLVLFPNLFVRKPFLKNLQLWDENNRKGAKLAAIGSADAHGTEHKLLLFSFNLLTHKRLFKSIRTNVLIEAGKSIDNGTILAALANGNSYIVNYRIGHPYNFYAGICKDRQQGVTFGEEIELVGGLKYYYNLPKDALVKLFRNGTLNASQNNKQGYFPINEKGSYRLQITRFGSGWIYTNNIYVV